MKTVSVGFIGAGFSANLRASSLRQVIGVPVRFAAVTASRPERAAEFARRHGVETVYDDYTELLRDPRIDAVCVCLPNALHAEVVIAAARAGKHIVCEKPLTGAFGPATATGADRARQERERAAASGARIAEEIAASGVRLCYAEDWVYAPALTKTKRLLELSGQPVLDIRGEESHSGSHARASRRRETAGGGSLLVLGAHPIGAALHLKEFEGRLRGDAGIRVESVTAVTAAFHDAPLAADLSTDWIVSDWEDVETWATTVLSFEDGSRAVISASFAMLGGIRNSFEVYTGNAVFRARMTPSDGLMVYSPDETAFGDEYLHEKVESRTGWIAASPDEDWVRGYPQEMQDFMECIVTDREPLSGLQLARDVVDVIYASYESAELGRTVRL